jgi:hypothetical protein
VAAAFFRSYGSWSLVCIAVLAGHDLINTFRDPSGAEWINLDIVLAGLLVVFAFVGVQGGRRSRLVRGGVAAAVGTFLTAWSFMAVWWMTTFYPFAQAQERNPYWLGAWRYGAGPGESFVDWIFWDNVGAVLIGGLTTGLLSLALGSIGGLIGSRLTPRGRRAAA